MPLWTPHFSHSLWTLALTSTPPSTAQSQRPVEKHKVSKTTLHKPFKNVYSYLKEFPSNDFVIVQLSNPPLHFKTWQCKVALVKWSLFITNYYSIMDYHVANEIIYSFFPIIMLGPFVSSSLNK